MKVSKPANISYYQSFQEVQLRDFSYCTKYLNQAAETKDPYERIKLVAANWFSGIHLSLAEIGNASPLNPILGETIQRVMPDGTRFCAE